jgi:ubiquitin carboxyl-terminal hydrolase 7
MIKPGADSKWYRVDDERVIPATLDDVLEENFGGEGASSLTGGMFNGLYNRLRVDGNRFKRFTSAYMLVYFREEILDEILAPINEEDVPVHVATEVNREATEEARRRKEKEEEHLYVTIRVVDIETFRHHGGLDLASFDPADKEAQKYVQTHKVKKESTWSQVYQIIGDKNHLPKSHIRLWSMINRVNKTTRPDVPQASDSQQSPPPNGKCVNGSNRSVDEKLGTEDRRDKVVHGTSGGYLVSNGGRTA